MTLHEDWHKANPGHPCEYDTCPRGQLLDIEEPKYTESDMRVLTEAALRLGRKEMAEELAKAFEERRPLPGWGVFSRQADIKTAARMVRLYARELLLPQDSQAALRACGCTFETSHVYGCPTGGGRITSLDIGDGDLDG